MKLKLALILTAAMCYMSALPLLRAGDLNADYSDGAALFDGAVKRQAEMAIPSPDAVDKERLTAEFKKQLILNDHGSSTEKTSLDLMISRMMESPTAREVAAQFIKEDAKAVVSFEEIPESTVVMVDGKEALWGTLGTTTYSDPPRVKINKFFMQHARDLAADTLAHELLGHAFERKRGGDALRTVQYYNTDEEENAWLIAWLVRTELNVKPTDEVWAYMQNPDANIEAMKTWAVGYAITLTSQEMKDPVPVYEKRLAAANKELEQLSKERYEEWNKMADHFVNEHKMPPDSFQTVRNMLSNAIKDLPRRRKIATAIRDKLRWLLESFSSYEGKIFLSGLSKEADNVYFRQKDAVIKARRKRLESLLLDKTQTFSKPPPPISGQITFDQLVKLWENDKKSCPSAAEMLK